MGQPCHLHPYDGEVRKLYVTIHYIAYIDNMKKILNICGLCYRVHIYIYIYIWDLDAQYHIYLYIYVYISILRRAVPCFEVI